MIKKSLALALLITGFLLAGNAHGEAEVYYCTDNERAGMNFKEKMGSYQLERGGIVLK